jgi:uncharacterized protein
LISDDWCALLRDYDVEIGISIDGPQQLHDRHRVSRNGQGTFRKVVAGIGRLKAFGIPFHVIAVLTRESLSAPEAIFDFFEDRQPTRVHFNIEEIEGANCESSLNFSDVQFEVARFFQAYWDLIEGRKSNQCIREIQSTVGAILEYGRGKQTINHLADPFSCISINCDGGVSTFAPELLSQNDTRYGNFVFGNILSDDMADIEKNEHLAKVEAAIARGNEQCEQTCDYFPVCGGASSPEPWGYNTDVTDVSWASAQSCLQWKGCTTKLSRLL